MILPEQAGALADNDSLSSLRAGIYEQRGWLETETNWKQKRRCSHNDSQ